MEPDGQTSRMNQDLPKSWGKGGHWHRAETLNEWTKGEEAQPSGSEPGLWSKTAWV